MAAKDKISQINRETPISAKKALEMVGELQKNGGQVDDVGGVFAVTLMNRFGINPKREKTLDGLKAKLIAHGTDDLSKVNPEKLQSKIDKKTEDISKSVTKSLKGDEKLEKLVKGEAEKIIRGKEVASIEDLSKNLQKKWPKRKELR